MVYISENKLKRVNFYFYEDSGQKDHKDDHDDQEYYCRNEPEYNYDDLKACNMAAPLDTDMGDITTSATPIVFEARVDSDHYHQLIRSINGISDIVLMPIPFPDNHHSSKKTQPWYRRWLSLWSKARSVKNDVDDIDWDGPQFILSQPMSMLPIDNESETDNDQSKNILLTLTPFSQLDRYSPKYQYNDYDQIKKRSIEKDAVMQVIASDVVF